jgi:hypothetical protein
MNKFIYLGKYLSEWKKNRKSFWDLVNICFGDSRRSIYDVMMTYAYKFMVLANYFMELTIFVLKGSVAFTFSGVFTQGLFCFTVCNFRDLDYSLAILDYKVEH